MTLDKIIRIEKRMLAKFNKKEEARKVNIAAATKQINQRRPTN